MKFWDLVGPEVAAADASPWNGPLASVMRPFDTAGLVRVYIASALLYGLAGAGGLFVTLSDSFSPLHEKTWTLVNAYGLVVAAGVVGLLLILSPLQLRRSAPMAALAANLSAPIVITSVAYAAGPHYGVTTATYVEAVLFAFYLFRRRWALVITAIVAVTFGTLVIRQDGWQSAIAQWTTLGTVIVATGVIVGVIAERGERLAAAEHDARVELAEVNRTLEQRVSDQVGEIERLGHLRRFLAPQVADVVLAHGADDLTQPHRRRIAVCFCDLRGFTSFTNHAEPEDVLSVLEEYYRAVGAVLQQHEATIGGYAGDGIMAYFGDPVPRDDAALAAVRMASELSHPMDQLVASWARRGHELSYGVGVAYGYATLGVVGFDGRYDYTPIGAVVNLAARLCGQAAPGQVLLDHATHAATTEDLPSAHFADFDFKGYGSATPTFALAHERSPS